MCKISIVMPVYNKEKYIERGIRSILAQTFKDWELIGIPYMVVCGKRAAEGIVEFKNRQTMIKEEVTILEAVERIISQVKNI